MMSPNIHELEQIKEASCQMVKPLIFMHKIISVIELKMTCFHTWSEYFSKILIVLYSDKAIECSYGLKLNKLIT